MSTVLHRMIAASSGIPPTILQMHALWEQITANSDAWAKVCLGESIDLKISARTLADGDAVQDMMQANMSFAFTPEMSPGLYAIAMNNLAAEQIAAARLRQGQDCMTSVSRLFLRLICEDPALALWRRITESFGDNLTDADQSPLGNLATDASSAPPADRYLKVELKGGLGGQSMLIWMLFEFDYIQRYARESRRRAGARSDTADLSARDALRDSIKTTTLALDVVLDRLSLTIGECSRLEVGQVLPLANGDTGRLSLCAETINDNIDIGHGEMGSWKQHRALKLHTPVLEEFVREMASF